MTTATQKVPSGYKQTEIGVIPADWDVRSLENLVKITSGESPTRFRLTNEGIPYFKVEQLNIGSKYQKETPYYIRGHKTVPKKSLIFPKRGASILLNKIKILSDDSFMDTNLMTLTVSEEMDNEYLYYSLIRFGLWRVADTTSIPQINNKHINPLLIALPHNKNEQTTIATALSDADSLIEKLEALIEKKRNIKQGAMQELLTGKRRLPGFSGKWEEKTLEEVADVNMGQSPSSRSYNTAGYGMPLIQGNADIENRKSVKRVWTTQKTKTCRTGDLIMTVRAPVGLIAIATEDSCLGRGVCSFKTKSVQKDFLFHNLIFKESSWKILEQGSTFTAANSTQIKGFELNIPPTQSEQTAIAFVLTDMDTEIEKLESQLVKYQNLKQGMMQSLLTGKIRLLSK